MASDQPQLSLTGFFCSFRTPNFNVKATFIQVLEKELILRYFEAKLWLQVAMDAMDGSGRFSVVVVEVHCG